MAKLLLSHRRGSRREGILVLVFYVLISTGFIAVPHYFFPGFHEKAFHYVWDAFVLGVCALVIFTYSIPNIVMNREFRFELFEDRIECKSPSKFYGESYSILLSDIVELEEIVDYDGPSVWYFVMRDGRKIRIITNYGNRDEKIVKMVRHLKPDLPVR